MNYRNFERHLSDTLQNDEVQLDIQSLIDGIHGTQKKDRKALFICLVPLALVGAIIFGLYFSLEKSTPLSPQTNAALPNTILVNEVNGEKKGSGPSSANDTEISKHDGNVSQVTPPTERQTLNKKSILPKGGETNKNIVEINTPSDLTTESKLSNAEYVATKSLDDENNQKEAVLLSNIQTMYPSPLSMDKHIFSRSTDKIVCPTFSKKSKLFLQLIPEIGYFAPLKTLENTSSEPNNIFSLRQNNEKSLEGLQAALYIQLRKGKSPFYLKTGVSYSTLTERMKLDYSYMTKDTTQGIISITVSQTGDTITTIYGDIVTDVTHSGRKTAHHSFSLVDIPVGVGYEKKLGEWVLGIEGGVMLNISSKSSGNILTSDTSFTSIKVPTTNFRTSLGISYFAGLTVGRDFDRIGRFYIALRGRSIPTAFSGDQNKIKQSYRFAGLNVGYVYTF